MVVNILEAHGVIGCSFRIGGFRKIPNEFKIHGEQLGRHKQKQRSNQLRSRIKQPLEGTSFEMSFRASIALAETQLE